MSDATELQSHLDRDDLYTKRETHWRERTESLLREAAEIELGGGEQRLERERAKGKMTARERVAKLCDPGSAFLEVGLWSAWGQYEEWGGAPAGGVVTGVGQIRDRQVMVVANDATVKAGAWFPATCKKVLRAQEIALENRLPLVYLVDSAGIFLPLQAELFADRDHFGRAFYNNAKLSSEGIFQMAAIMGSCVAGGAYLPIMSDESHIVEGTGSIFLAGLPPGEGGDRRVDRGNEDLGGAVRPVLTFQRGGRSSTSRRCRVAWRKNRDRSSPRWRRRAAGPRSLVAKARDAAVPRLPADLRDSYRWIAEQAVRCCGR